MKYKDRFILTLCIFVVYCLIFMAVGHLNYIEKLFLAIVMTTSAIGIFSFMYVWEED